jgi:exopolyphosphatase/guanosine-5'-triphosphate,3'-diphosphate pyrophosphatase
LDTVAAIDVGSSSIHALLVKVERGRLVEVGRMKERVRLVSGAQRTLDPVRAGAAIEALGRIARWLVRSGAASVVAAATSAVRDASDGPAFVERVRRATGLHLRVLSAHEEATLSYRAARETFVLGERRALFLDIGGGSAQIVVGDGRELLFAESLPLGVIRTTERFLRSDPPVDFEVRSLVAHLDEQLAPVVAHVRASGAERAIGTSGTIRALAGVLAHRRGERGSKDFLRSRPIALGELRRLAADLACLDCARRAAIPRLPEHRADTIVAGALLVERVLAGARLDRLTPSRAGLREGLIREHLEGSTPTRVVKASA